MDITAEPPAQSVAGVDADTAPPPPPRARRLRIVAVVSVSVVLPEQFPTVVVEDVEEHHRQLTFRVGMAEGAAIAAAMEQRALPRPLTHDLFAQVLERFSVDVAAVRLTGRVGATYLAEIELTGARGRELLSCRPSDGIALAFRRRVAAPILADERLFMETGDVLPELAPRASVPARTGPSVAPGWAPG